MVFTFSVVDPVDVLRADAHSARLNCLAISTRRNLATHLTTFLIFTIYFGLQSFPVSEDVLVVYIQFLSRNFKSVASIKNYVFGIQTISNFNNFPFPDLTIPLFQYQFKGLARSLCHTTHRASPINPAILLKILQFLDLSDPFQASFWAVVLCGFLLFARIGNLLPKSKKYDHAKQLSRSDVFVAQDAVIFSLKWTKTIQTAERVLQIPLYSNSQSDLCPKFALFNMISVSPGHSQDHLFSYSTSKGLQVITQSVFISFLRKVLSQAGFDASKFSGHSLRRGGASHAFSKGVPSELIKSHGDWKSESYLIYLDFTMEDRLLTTKLMLS